MFVVGFFVFSYGFFFNVIAVVLALYCSCCNAVFIIIFVVFSNIIVGGCQKNIIRV